jgi:flagellar basal body rod protein FlgG
VSGIVQQFTQGNISVTNNPLDTAINGGGFFQMDDGQGGTVQPATASSSSTRTASSSAPRACS